MSCKAESAKESIKTKSGRKRKLFPLYPRFLKVLSLDYLSCPKNLDYRARERQRKSDRPAKLNEKKSDRDLEREIENKGDIFEGVNGVNRLATKGENYF